MNRTTWFLGMLLAVLLASPARAQVGSDARTSTEQRLRELREQISLDEQRLSETAQAEETTLETLRELDRKLAIRRDLIASYQTRMDQLVTESDSLRATLREMEEDFGYVKHQYRRRAVHAYKYGRLHDLALILSANSINQMLVRVRYLSRFTDQRRGKLEEFMEVSRALEDRRQELAEARVQTQLLLREAEDQRRKMLNLQQDRKQVIRQLQSQKASLEGELNAKRTAAEQFETQMRALISAETARRRERVATNPRAEIEYAGLSGSFLQNRGKLPWPASGAVVEPFGDLVNPVHGTKTPNPGLLIATNPQAEVRAVFDGVVLGVSVMPEFGTYVAVQHGEYQSVYSNFSMVYVGEGDAVKAGQLIGRAGTDSEPKQAGIFFGLFKNGSPFDPTPWLRRR